MTAPAEVKRTFSKVTMRDRGEAVLEQFRKDAEKELKGSVEESSRIKSERGHVTVFMRKIAP